MIEDTLFLVSVEKDGLVEKRNPSNILHCYDMQPQTTFYSFRFDRENKKIVSPDIPDTASTVHVTIPQLAILDPVGMKEKYGYSFLRMEMMSDFEIVIDAAAMIRRLEGVLPLIDVAGKAYLVDIAQSKLRSLDDPNASIDLNSAELSKDGLHFECYLNIKDHSLYRPPTGISSAPEHVVFLKIPSELELDPLKVAQDKKLDLVRFLRMHPIQRDLRADVVPLDKSPLNMIIKANRAKIKSQKNAKTQGKGRKPRRS